MPIGRIVGLMLLAVGVGLLVVGHNATEPPLERIAKALTGKYSHETQGDLFGGIATPRDCAVVAAGLAILIGVDTIGLPIVRWLGDLTGRLTRYPVAPDRVLGLIDDTFGCLLTGLSEEAIFRFYLINVLLLRGWSM